MLKNVLTALVTLVVLLAILELSLFVVGLILKARIDVRAADLDPETKRVICIGESTTFGLRVKKSEAYCAQLQDKLQADTGRKIKTYNLGMAAITSTTMLRSFETNLLRFRPTLAIVNMGHNDFSRSLNQQNSIRDPNLSMTLTKFLYQFRTFRLYQLLKDVRNERNAKRRHRTQSMLVAEFSPAEEKVRSEEFMASVGAQLEFNTRQMISTARSYDVDLLFVGYMRSSATTIMRRIVQDEGAQWVDVRTSRPLEPFTSHDGWHPSAAGHEHIANRIATKIEDQGLLD